MHCIHKKSYEQMTVQQFGYIVSLCAYDLMYFTMNLEKVVEKLVNVLKYLLKLSTPPTLTSSSLFKGRFILNNKAKITL